MKFKKLLVLVLCLALALCCFTACGSNESGNAGNSGKSGSDVIKIGFLGPKTGGVAQYGLAVEQGVNLYVELLNKAGGINGKQVEVVAYDEEGDQAKALVGYASLLDSEVVGIVGDVTTGPCVAVAQAAYQDNFPVITASATASTVTYDEATGTVYSNMFRSCFIDPFQGVVMANFAKEECSAKTAAVLYDSGDTYSTGVYQYFVKQAKEIGLSIVAEEAYASGAASFTSQLTTIANAKPDVLFLPVYYNDVAVIAAQAKELNLNAQFLGVDGWSSVLDTVTDPALVEGAYYCSGYSPADTGALVQQFLKDYAAKFPGSGTPNMFVAQGYDAAWILCDAITKADAAGKLNNETIIANMKATDGNYVTGHVTYDDHNDPQKSAAIIHIEGGKENFWGTK